MWRYLFFCLVETCFVIFNIVDIFKENLKNNAEFVSAFVLVSENDTKVILLSNPVP